MIRLAVAAAVLVAAAVPARADDARPAAPAKPGMKKPRKPLPPYKPGKPDRWAVQGAEEANLEGTGIRSGFAFVAGIGPALQIGVSGPEHSTGTGGAFTFRLGRFANRDTLITLEICGTVYPYKFDPDGEGEDGPMPSVTKYNQSALATFGVQTYVAPTFWVRAAAGFASFTSREPKLGGQRTDNHFGGGGVAGAGLEMVRRKSVSLAVEVLFTGAIYRDGVILGGGLGLSLGVY